METNTHHYKAAKCHQGQHLMQLSNSHEDISAPTPNSKEIVKCSIFCSII